MVCSPARRILLALLLCLTPTTAFAEAGEGGDKASLEISNWLTLAPSQVHLPAFHGEDFGLAEWLGETTLALDQLRPQEGSDAPWPPGHHSPWRAEGAGGDGLTLTAPSGDGHAAAWLVAWLDTDRFLDATLNVESPHLLRVWVGDGEVASKDKIGEDGAASAELSLDAGHHRILVLAARDAGSDENWTVAASLELESGLEDTVRFTHSPRRPLAIDDFLESPAATSVDLSKSGRYLAVGMRSPAAPAEHGEQWLDIYEVSSGRRELTLRGGSSFAWSRTEEDVFVFARGAHQGSDVVLGGVGDGERRTLARGLEHLSGLRFADADTLILTVTETPEADERPAKRYRDLPDRWTTRRDESHLYALELDGTRTRLTVGATFDVLQDIHPEGNRLLLSRQVFDRRGRPFSTSTLVELDLETLEPREIVKLGWFGSAFYSPEGSHALVLGSPALFDGAGTVLPDRIANDYDTQAYLLDLSSGDAKALSRDLDPTIQGALWPSSGGAHFRLEDRSWHRLARLDASSGTFENLELGVDTFRSFDVAGGQAAYIGSGVNQPPAVWVTDGKTPRRISFPAEAMWSDIDFGESRDWTFTSSAGDEILGRVYLPPGVDESAEGSYPLIVYYYGGTSPVSRDFAGRYPKEWWAAQGYVVYVLQPSGTTGFGQEFSARHVNAWGRQTADEILEGTRLFLDAHDFVDPKRVGAIGASYGGFMTMYLQTRSKIFSAAVSHAGISNMASYWGQGWWGFLYSDAASAGSFPWNARDLYVEQSPLYHADKITTPLLLLHGTADINVPPVESHQMYTALKVLGREVELIEIHGANHSVLSLEKRRLWSRSILAWFNRYLKGEPELWTHLWGSDDEPKG